MNFYLFFKFKWCIIYKNYSFHTLKVKKNQAEYINRLFIFIFNRLKLLKNILLFPHHNYVPESKKLLSKKGFHFDFNLTQYVKRCQILRSNLAQRKLSLIVDQKKIHIHLQLLDEHDILNQNYVFLRIF